MRDPNKSVARFNQQFAETESDRNDRLRRKRLKKSAPYGEMCRDPELCAGKGYCPRDPTCGRLAMNQELTCWLIEAAWSREQPAYLATTRGSGGHFFEWRFEPHRAIKFATRQSADDVLMAVRELRPELFPSVVPHPSITEHVFVEDSLDLTTMKHLGSRAARELGVRQ